LPRMRKERTYVIVEVDNNQADVVFYDSEGNIVEELSTKVNL